MPWIETSVLKETWDVDRRLRELALSRGSLLVVRDVALNEAANATPNHCANAAGTFSYQHGTWALRDQFAGLRWTVDRADGVEAIFNKDLNIRIAFQNVDRACDDEIAPAPRSEKGAGAERLCQGNGLFGQLPRFAPVPFDKCATFYLMTASDGLASCRARSSRMAPLPPTWSGSTCRMAATSPIGSLFLSTPTTRQLTSIRRSPARRENRKCFVQGGLASPARGDG